MKYNINVVPLTKENLSFHDFYHNNIENFKDLNMPKDPIIDNKNRQLLTYLIMNNMETLAYGAGKSSRNDISSYGNKLKKYTSSSKLSSKKENRGLEIAGSIGFTVATIAFGFVAQTQMLGNLLGFWKPTLWDPKSWFAFKFTDITPIWAANCEDGWDWGSISCSTVSTDVVHSHMAVWQDFRTNECETFGKNRFDTMVSKNYPEGRYYCDNSIHGIDTVFRKNKDDIEMVNKKDISRGLSRSCVPGDNPELETIIESEILTGKYEDRPGGIHHESSGENSKYIQNRGDSKVKVDFNKTCFSDIDGHKGKNFPVPPIVSWDGSTPDGGLEPSLLDGGSDEDIEFPTTGVEFEYCDDDDPTKCNGYKNPCRTNAFINAKDAIDNDTDKFNDFIKDWILRKITRNPLFFMLKVFIKKEYKDFYNSKEYKAGDDTDKYFNDVDIWKDWSGKDVFKEIGGYKLPPFFLSLPQAAILDERWGNIYNNPAMKGAKRDFYSYVDYLRENDYINLDKSNCITRPMCKFVQDSPEDPNSGKCLPKYDTKKPPGAEFNSNKYNFYKKRKQRFMEFCDTKDGNANCPRKSNPCKCGDDFENEYGTFHIERLCTKDECSYKNQRNICTYDERDSIPDTLENPKCRTGMGFALSRPETGLGTDTEGYYDSNINSKSSRYKYNLKNPEDDTKTEYRKHQKRDQYAKYMDCRRHGLDDYECNDSYPMTKLEKWCDSLSIPHGYESWKDDDFSPDYRYTINRIDMIPKEFTSDLEVYEEADSPEIISRFPQLWMNSILPRPLGYSDYKMPDEELKPFWEKKEEPEEDELYKNLFSGMNGHTDAIPGGNNWDGKSSIKSHIISRGGEHSLLFLNRGYCPTRLNDVDAGQFGTKDDDPMSEDKDGFGLSPYSQKTHKYAREYTTTEPTEAEKQKGYTDNSKKICGYLNERHNEHVKALIKWKYHHDLYHKLNPSINILNADMVIGSSECTLDSVNDAVNTLQLCRKYGIGGKELGQIFFTNPEYMFGPIDQRCKSHPKGLCVSDKNCMEEVDDNGETICVAKMAKKLAQKHGEHLFSNCSSNTIMDFEYICESLNIPLTNTDNDLFTTYNCNARDVIRKIKKCEANGIRVSEGEVCSDRVQLRKVMATKNQTIVYDNERDELYAELLQVRTNRNKKVRDKLLKSQQHEYNIQIEAEAELVDDSEELNKLEREILVTTDSVGRKREAMKEYEKILECKVWTNGTEFDKVPYRNIKKDPSKLAGGVDISKNPERIKELNDKCSKMEEPFPKKIIIGFCTIILIILIIAMVKLR
jgi:hypothetical protein